MNWRKLKHNKGCQIARHLIFVDCETKPTTPSEDNTGRHKLWFGVARSGCFKNRNSKLEWGCRDWLRFEQAEEFWAWAIAKAGTDKTTWIYAHNAGFDFVILGLLNKLESRELTISKPRKSRNKQTGREQIYGLIMLDDPPTCIGVETRDGQRFVLCDTINYWRVSLSTLGESVGLDKYDMPSYDAPDAIWTRYCNRDVEVIESAITELIRWWRETDLGNWKWTAPSLAWSAFRHRFMRHEIVFHDEMPVRQHERDAYFGGQLEAYQLGEINEPVYQYDVVSLYPSVMQHNLYPVKLKEWDLDRPYTTTMPFADPLTAIAKVEVDTTHDTYPVRNPDGVWYCNGVGRITLAGPELSYAIERGHVRAYGGYAVYSMGEIFTDYVRFFFELKQQYDKQDCKVKRTFVKLLLNSLYGKFAQRGGRWRYNPDRQPLWDFGLFWEHDTFTKQYTKHLGLYDAVFDWAPKQEIEQASPAIAAFVTGYARQHMRMLRQVAGEGNYYYQSTDSLLVNQQARNNFEKHGGLIGSDMGQLKLEVGANSAWIGGLHYYRIGDKLIEGSKKSSAETIGEGIWSELQFDSLLRVIGRSKTDRDGMNAIDIRRIEKHRKNEYTKGRVTSDGRIEPYKFSDIAESNRLSNSA